MTNTINMLEPGTTLEGGVYLLINPQAGTKGNGDPYLRCMLRDATGEVAGRRWTFDPGTLSTLERASVVEVNGEVVRFQGKNQINIHDLTPLDATPALLSSLMPVSSRDIEEMFGEVVAVLRTIGDASLRGLAEAVLDDEPLVNAFKSAPAAMSMHHAFIGGLLEHTNQMLRIADATVGLYAHAGIALDRDLVLLGVLFHDLAKTTELQWTDRFGYTVRGNLIGHIVDGAAMVEAKAAEAELNGAPSVPEHTLTALQNIVLSHHGSAEHGAARPAMTPEAVLVARIDALEAHTRMAVDACDGREAGMTDIIRGLGHRLYVRPRDEA
ncbi:MAG: HD domain-containing protein [Phycisphaerales bacterium]|nr:HD domain-containing protein [Phycisphaerales bacterium]